MKLFNEVITLSNRYPLLINKKKDEQCILFSKLKIIGTVENEITGHLFLSQHFVCFKADRHICELEVGGFSGIPFNFSVRS